MMVFKNLFRKLGYKNMLYFPGCLTKRLKNIEENYKKILGELGINFVTLRNEEFCCGLPVLNAGYRKDFQKLVSNNLDLFNGRKISGIITNCPGCFWIFSKEYNIKVEHISKVIWDNIDRLKLQQLQSFNETVSYHDPCYLGRYMGVYDEPRRILKSVGFEVVELENNKKRALCCGAGGGLVGNLPRTSAKIADSLLKEVKTKKLITTCPLCYQHLKKNSSGIRVLELSEVLV